MLENKVAVVTGGTRGIGYAIVKKYLEHGAKVVLFGSRQETAEKAVASLKEENEHWTVEGMWPRLTDAKEVETAILAVKEKYGRIDILVNNAGVSESTKIYDYTPELFDKVLDLNVKAMMYTIIPTVKLMKEQGGGCIINTSLRHIVIADANMCFRAPIAGKAGSDLFLRQADFLYLVTAFRRTL